MAQSLYSGLSPRARGREFPPATMSMTPSYFRRKQKKMRPQELTGSWVPHLTNCIYPATWNLSDSLSYLYQLIIIIIIIIITIIITYYYYYFYWILSWSSSIHFDYLICSLRAACTVRHALLDLTVHVGATHPVHICQIPQGVTRQWTSIQYKGKRK